MPHPKSRMFRKLVALLKFELEKLPENQPERNKRNIQQSRRRFIEHSAKAAIGVSLSVSMPAFLSSCRNTPSSASADTDAPPVVGEKPLDIAILGGGIAGLNCANHLLESGHDFKIFEAQKRVGGRILTHYNDPLGLGIYPEFGGDFIDTGHEDMLALAKEFGLELYDLEAEMKKDGLVKDVYLFNDKIFTEKDIIREFRKIAPKIAADYKSLGENYDTEAAKKFDLMPLSEYFASLKCAKWLKDVLIAGFVSEFGLDCNEQSTINFLDLIDPDTSGGFKIFGESDERFRIKGGNSKIIEGLEKKIGSDRILKRYEVTEVSEQDDGSYKISFTDQKPVLAGMVVCTIPFTILRKIKMSLKNISPEKQKCINELGYGMNTKLVLGYNERSWRSKENKAMGYLFHKDIVNGWDSSYNKLDNSDKAAFVCYFGGKFSVDLDGVAVRNPMSPPQHTWRTQLPEAKVDEFVNVLDKAFKNSKKHFNNKHIFVNWIDFPYTKGSYACYKPGQWTTIAGLEMQPVGKFLFAGEHCSAMFQGFMNGGAETGRHVAEAIKASVDAGTK